MSNIIEKFNGIKNLEKVGGCSASQIELAEKELNISFPNEYIEFLKEFGTIRFSSKEWFGLNVNGYLNVVEATKQERSINKNFPLDSFVLEDLGIDAKLIIVNEKGQVFLIQIDKKELLCNSLSEYLDICIARNNKTV